MSGECEGVSKAITQQMVETILNRHGKEFEQLIANFQKFIQGMVTVSQQEDPQAHCGYSLAVERCYELNRQQRLSLLKYLANEIVVRAQMLATTPEKYPSPEEFEKSKS